MTVMPRIHPHAIDLLTRVFNSHKKGIPEWLKNAREAYFRKVVSKENRFVIINYQEGRTKDRTWLECIDFVGISGDDIENRYIEWGNPDAAKYGLKPGEAEGGQGNGGKAYLRQMFESGYFASICDKKLSIVGFVDPPKKYILDFIPDKLRGKDITGHNQKNPELRQYGEDFFEGYKLPPTHNITIVRGIAPLKPINVDRLIDDIQQFPQARETIRTCQVHFYVNREFRRELKIIEPKLHPSFPTTIKIPIPSTLNIGGSNVKTAQLPDFPPGELELNVTAKPLQGQSLSWNSIDFYGIGVSVIGWKKVEELPLSNPQFCRHIYGRCSVPLLVDPKENYEMQGRVQLNEGPLSDALYKFIAQETDNILKKLEKQESGTVAVKKRKNLEKLNNALVDWIETKLASLRGLPETGDDVGTGKRIKHSPQKKEHKPPVEISIHRSKLEICQGLKYQLRAVAFDENKRPVPPGRVLWKSHNSAIVSINPDTGLMEAKSVGLATISISNDIGLEGKPLIVQVHEAAEIEIKNHSPIIVGSNRRVQLLPIVKTVSGKTHKDIVVGWRSNDGRVVTVGQDGWLVGMEPGEVEVVACVGRLESDPIEVKVEKGAAGLPKGGGKGKPRILLSGQDNCPFDNTPVILAKSDPLVFQRHHKPDYDNNVFWINLQHPLADSLLKMGEGSVQWRTYHFQRLVDVYTTLEMRNRFGDDQNLDVDQVFDAIRDVTAEIHESAKDEIFEILYDDKYDIASIVVR